MRPIVEIDGLSKRYRLGQFNAASIREETERWLRRLGPRSEIRRHRNAEFWALRDVSFSVQRGEVIGIIGRNGAGKSTLLKILSRVTEPTAGIARIRGRVASLLEVGTGFHLELTGRENIFLNGTILGMTKAEVRARFDEIVAFAEIERFVDTPIKRYSSGMHVRLAFAVAAHLEPDILIVDEVLAVGDVAFQKRCIGKMRELRVAKDRTVLFVSHDMGAITALCPRTILLRNGSVAADGGTQSVTATYIASASPRASIKRYGGDDDDQTKDDHVALQEVRVLDSHGHESHQLQIEHGGAIEIVYSVHTPGLSPTPIVHLATLDGCRVLASIMGGVVQSTLGVHRAIVYIPGNLLNNISYKVGICIATLNPERTHCEDLDALTFDVLDSPRASNRDSYRGNIPGTVRPDLRWSYEPVGSARDDDRDR